MSSDDMAGVRRIVDKVAWTFKKAMALEATVASVPPRLGLGAHFKCFH